MSVDEGLEAWGSVSPMWRTGFQTARSHFDPRLTDSVEDGIRIAEKLDADLAKMSLESGARGPCTGVVSTRR